jgi:malonyl CoA-acyl carrier protein transacylase
VRFVECVQAAAALGARAVLEPAPGSVLCSLVRRIEPGLETYPAASADAVAALMAPGARP